MKKENRYSRQIILPEIGSSGQKKLSQASILCIGAGGLGCPVLLYLTAAGVGKIGIIDFDTVEETNLQRQVLFTNRQIGQNKAEAAAEYLQAINPGPTIQVYADELTDQNAVSLFKNYDIIIDGTDTFAAKFLISDAAVIAGKPLVYGSVLGFDGQVSVLNHKNGPCYRCLFPAPPESYVPNCAEAGIIGAVAGITGTAQAIEAIKIILDHEDLRPISGKLWTIDTRSMQSHVFDIPKNINCETCAKPNNEITLHYSRKVCENIEQILPKHVPNKKDFTLIDVRELDEWEEGHIDSAQHMPLSSLKKGILPNIPMNQKIIVFCQRGRRGQQAATILKDQGYTKVKNMAGGYEAWLCIECD